MTPLQKILPNLEPQSGRDLAGWVEAQYSRKHAPLARIDLGSALGTMPAEGCLIDTGSFARKDGITHRIGVSFRGEVDDERLG